MVATVVVRSSVDLSREVATVVVRSSVDSFRVVATVVVRSLVDSFRVVATVAVKSEDSELRSNFQRYRPFQSCAVRMVRQSAILVIVHVLLTKVVRWPEISREETDRRENLKVGT